VITNPAFADWMRNVRISIVTCALPRRYHNYPQIHLPEGATHSDISEHLRQLAERIRSQPRIRASTEDRGGGWDDEDGHYDENGDEYDDDGYGDSEGDWDDEDGDENGDEYDDDEYWDSESDWDGDDEARSSSASQGEDTLVQSEDDDVYGSVRISVRARFV
jgi:hypothetical protein